MDLIYMITPGTSEIESNSIMPLSTIARRTGRIIKSNTNSVLLSAPGYYRVTASITFTAPAEGDVTVDLQKGGIAVPGITASATITTPTTEIENITLSGVVRVFPLDSIAVLTLFNSGVAITSSNISFEVEYLG